MKPLIAAWEFRVEFAPRDLWVGVYWTRRGVMRLRRTDVWVCLLPMLPLHIVHWRTYPDARGDVP